MLALNGGLGYYKRRARLFLFLTGTRDDRWKSKIVPMKCSVPISSYPFTLRAASPSIKSLTKPAQVKSPWVLSTFTTKAATDPNTFHQEGKRPGKCIPFARRETCAIVIRLNRSASVHCSGLLYCTRSSDQPIFGIHFATGHFIMAKKRHSLQQAAVHYHANLLHSYVRTCSPL